MEKNTIFSQMVRFLSPEDFRKIVQAYGKYTNGKCHEINVVRNDMFGFLDLPQDSQS